MHRTLNHHNHHSKGAFTLVELAITLIILGVITSGVVAGNSLMRASQLRTAITEFQAYKNAAQAFIDRPCRHII